MGYAITVRCVDVKAPSSKRGMVRIFGQGNAHSDRHWEQQCMGSTVRGVLSENEGFGDAFRQIFQKFFGLLMVVIRLKFDQLRGRHLTGLLQLHTVYGL